MQPNIQIKGTSVPMTIASSTTITTGGTAQAVFAATRRHYLLFQNTSSGTMMLTIDGSTPSATNGMALTQNAGYEATAAVSSSTIQVWCSTTGATFYAIQG
jgi:hypothetical protein